MFQQTLDRIAALKRELWLRPWKKRSRRETAEYLQQNADCVRLNFGAAAEALDGWLNTDIWPHRGAVFLDATQPFPFAGESVHFINSEQMIEHLTFDEGRRFLAECRRVLRPGGVLRLTTPNLRRQAELYLGRDDFPMEKLLEHHREWHRRPHVTSACHWLNDHFYLWGHRFLYDEETLLASLREAGFERIEPRAFGESEHPELQGVEIHDEGKEWMRSLFIMTFEATK